MGSLELLTFVVMKTRMTWLAVRWFEDDFRIRAPGGCHCCVCASIPWLVCPAMACLKLLSKFHAGEACIKLVHYWRVKVSSLSALSGRGVQIGF